LELKNGEEQKWCLVRREAERVFRKEEKRKEF